MASPTLSSLPSSSAAHAVASLAAAAAAAATAAGEAEKADQVAEAYENAHVHGVYEAIAPHFSATRYKPWPAVAEFLRAQPPGAVGLDVGCGNGKYLGVNPSLVMLGSDRSPALVALARDRVQSLERPLPVLPGPQPVAVAPTPTAPVAVGTDVLVADGLSLPFRDGAVDFVICVAVVHHLSTRPRRQDSIRRLLACVKGNGQAAGTGGKVLVYVWALEQGNSRRGWEEGGEQDLLVPWVLKSPKPQQKKQKQPKQRQNGEPPLTESLPSPPPPPPPPTGEDGNDGSSGASHTDPVFRRFYHLYRQGELEEDVLAAGGAVVASGYEKDNWWTVATNQ
ncbi:S-adenosyl-L-methionine-dependent methyltransferase [Lasiosphaeria miniovina]|uniref:S-adenosyl-L-methionine-dependent methyltransferase n=1 Tax=Lasiosphaeria miniovina TaxID=1954250 RepID=A0AA40DKB8_9PEZI|nr:S-adenosyl-L-methionine-dependent methyltransferase [Lasiosphaeria miniovina]KAK0706834.1 S-adenosyl-L-methionine-dependent methyltransferase [Lasiosphaeria miniovina]